jgi:hypothetical protein
MKPGKRRRRRGRGASGKGALIKGMSRRLPRGLLDDEEFRRELEDLLQGYSGIYALYDRGNLYYVGLTEDLFRRLRSHGKRLHRKRWDSFTVFRIQRVRYLKDIETLIHHLVDCPGNKVRGQVPRDADLSRILRRVLSQREREIRQLRRVIRRG